MRVKSIYVMSGRPESSQPASCRNCRGESMGCARASRRLSTEGTCPSTRAAPHAMMAMLAQTSRSTPGM